MDVVEIKVNLCVLVYLFEIHLINNHNVQRFALRLITNVKSSAVAAKHQVRGLNLKHWEVVNHAVSILHIVVVCQ